MAVVIRNSIQEITLQLLQFIHSATKKSASCGVIVAPCANMNQKTLEQAKMLMSQNDASHSVQLFYDVPNQVLCAVLDGGTMGSTHYASLVLKDFLHNQHLLQGQLIVSSFPESGNPTESAIAKFIQQAIQSKGNEGDIHFFSEANAATSVLIVDTDDVVREFIKIRLELKGYRVYEAKDGQEAYNIFVRILPDLVITELNLPIMDGYQLIRQIGRNDANEGKVIVLTDKQLSGNMSRAYESGAADYVTKPLSISELEWKIKRLTTNN
ncbi:response regulator transcription factor [Paenibacillus spongiae]|uniref:Response regulator n=1 Tax=Paenibacillus spongiae TaxID=2909671 RepID=A0ABY5SGQ0_9BACL|nr:response regulator [Paenibacillus spongiae]UVI32834.1 response regulator [Paenibacillus spongiae]